LCCDFALSGLTPRPTPRHPMLVLHYNAKSLVRALHNPTLYPTHPFPTALPHTPLYRSVGAWGGREHADPPQRYIDTAWDSWRVTRHTVRGCRAPGHAATLPALSSRSNR